MKNLIVTVFVAFLTTASSAKSEMFGYPFDDFLGDRSGESLEDANFSSTDYSNIGSQNEVGIRDACSVGSYFVRCWVDGPTSRYERPIPVLPDELAARWALLTQSDFLARLADSETLLDTNPAKLELANQHFTTFHWVAASDGALPLAISQYWRTAFEAATDVGILEEGQFFTVRNSPFAPIQRTYQVCDLFGNDRPLLPCMAVLVESNGEFYVRFASSEYNGGYSFDPQIFLSCEHQQRTSIDPNPISAALQQPPFSLVEYFRRKTAFGTTFSLKSELSPSALFTGYFEIVDLSVGYNLWDGKDTYEIDFNLLISRQNVATLRNIRHPSIEQSKYYAERVVALLNSVPGCGGAEVFFPSDYLTVVE